MTKRGRPRAAAPRGRVTLQVAADLAGVSYASAHRRVADGVVRSERDESGVVTIARNDVRMIKLRPAADTNRHAVMLRPTNERYAAWEHAAGGKPVSVWLGDLADKASIDLA